MVLIYYEHYHDPPDILKRPLTWTLAACPRVCAGAPGPCPAPPCSSSPPSASGSPSSPGSSHDLTFSSISSLTSFSLCRLSFSQVTRANSTWKMALYLWTLPDNDLALVENLLLLRECLHPELDVSQHVNGADVSLILSDNLVLSSSSNSSLSWCLPLHISSGLTSPGHPASCPLLPSETHQTLIITFIHSFIHLYFPLIIKGSKWLPEFSMISSTLDASFLSLYIRSSSCLISVSRFSACWFSSDL